MQEARTKTEEFLAEIERKDKAMVRRENREENKTYLIWMLALVLGIAALGLVTDKIIMPLVVGADEIVRVPDVVQLDSSRAVSVLRHEGLNPIIAQTHYHEEVEAGHIVSQLPHSNSEVKSGRRIYLVASRGQEYITMPELRGLLLRDARIKLLERGLLLDEVRYEHNQGFPTNQVFVQSKAANSAMRYNESVNVVVSLGPEIFYVTVPDLTGRTLAEAAQILKEAGLELGFKSQSSDETFVKGTIIDQFPMAGEQVEPGAAINVSENY